MQIYSIHVHYQKDGFFLVWPMKNSFVKSSEIVFSNPVKSLFNAAVYIIKLLQQIFKEQIVVEDSGIEPLTSCVQGRRSPS